MHAKHLHSRSSGVLPEEQQSGIQEEQVLHSRNDERAEQASLPRRQKEEQKKDEQVVLPLPCTTEHIPRFSQ